ncbi:MAG: A/G-specific adenine glycosylase [Brevinema sp.]
MPQKTACLNALATWFRENCRQMPWRDNPTPYKVWISEIMLQQTTVATVMGYFQRFLEAFPTLSDLAAADEQEVLHLWAGLGYYSRARNILSSAKKIKSEENFPKSVEDLLQLPGIGPYTAGAIASIAYNQPVSLVDTNVERVLGRLNARKRGEGFQKVILNDANELIEQAFALKIAPSVWNQALMELGALVCSPNLPKCSLCPVQQWCKGNISPDIYPGDKPKVVLNMVEESVIVEGNAEKVVLAQNIGRRRTGLWDFPLGTIEKEAFSFRYRISNDSVLRHVGLKIDQERPLLENEKRFLWDELPPLTSPAKKILYRHKVIINKVFKSLDKMGGLL